MDHYTTKNSFTRRNKHRTHLKPTKADICRQKPTYRHMPTKKPTYADQNRHMPTYADHADKSRQSDICRHMPTYADQGRPKPTQPTKTDGRCLSVLVGVGCWGGPNSLEPPSIHTHPSLHDPRLPVCPLSYLCALLLHFPRTCECTDELSHVMGNAGQCKRGPTS